MTGAWESAMGFAAKPFLTKSPAATAKLAELWPVCLTVTGNQCTLKVSKSHLSSTPFHCRILQALTKACFEVQDFEFLDSLTGSHWILLISQDLPRTPPTPIPPPLDLSPTQMETSTPLANHRPSKIADFIIRNESQMEEVGILTNIWVIVDQLGLETSICIVADRDFDYDEENDGGKFVDTFKATRLPIADALGMMAKLSIANMGFEDYADLDAGVGEDGFYKWIGPFPWTNDAQVASDREVEAKREKP